MKRTIGTAAAVLSLAFATPALAADFILHEDFSIGSSAANFYIDFESPTEVSAFLSNRVGANTFLDRYIFAPTFIGTGSGAAITNLQANLTFGLPGLRIDGYSLADAGAAIGNALVTAFTAGDTATYDSAVAQLTAYLSGTPTAVYSQVGVVDDLNRQLFNVPLDTANFYVISIDGEGTSAGSLYSGNLSATSVPEPGTWAMMLAGFGFIGFAMRRKSQAHPKVRFAF